MNLLVDREQDYNSDEMDQRQQSELAARQLDRVLGFFPRADAKGSVLLALDTGMLAVLAANLPSFGLLDCWLLITVIPLVSIALSIWHLYQGAFPSLEGGRTLPGTPLKVSDSRPS